MTAAQKSYYATLAVPRTAAIDDIKKSYRKLSLKWHPERAVGPKAEAEAAFLEIAESYDVLSNPARRAIYDQYGERGLKEGVPDGEGGVKGGKYRFANNAADIFAAFFGTSSPFADILGGVGEEIPAFYGELTGMQLPYTKTKPAAICVPLYVTLAEVYNGAMKKVSYTRKKLGEDGVTFDDTVESHLYVKSGWAAGVVATLPGQGDEGVHLLPGDVDIEMIIAEDASWERQGKDLIFSTKITLCEALCGTIVDVPTFDGRTLSIPLTQIITIGDSKTVPGEGMPGEEGKGDLIIAFDVEYPATLTPAQKAAIKKTLG